MNNKKDEVKKTTEEEDKEEVKDKKVKTRGDPVVRFI